MSLNGVINWYRCKSDNRSFMITKNTTTECNFEYFLFSEHSYLKFKGRYKFR